MTEMATPSWVLVMGILGGTVVENILIDGDPQNDSGSHVAQEEKKRAIGVEGGKKVAQEEKS